MVDDSTLSKEVGELAYIDAVEILVGIPFVASEECAFVSVCMEVSVKSNPELTKVGIVLAGECSVGGLALEHLCCSVKTSLFPLVKGFYEGGCVGTKLRGYLG